MEIVMKRFYRIVLALFVSASLLTTSVVIAQGWGANRGAGFSQNRSAGYGPGRVLRAEMVDARIEVLAELSELSKDEIKAKLQYKPMWAVLDEVKVDFTTYQKAMHEKAKTVVTQAVTDGKITKTQGDYMLERMKNGPMGPRGNGRGRGAGMGKGRNWN
jgi:hypothetical protein